MSRRMKLAIVGSGISGLAVAHTLKDHADITVFDPIRINGKASVENPNQFSDGIEMVLVNGKVAYRSQKLMESAGMPIRY